MFLHPARPTTLQPALAALALALLTRGVSAAALTPGDILVSESDPAPYLVQEYTPAGTLVQTFTVPLGPGEDSSTGVLRQAIVSPDGNIQVYDGTFDPSLATVNPITGAVAYHQGLGFSTANNGTFGGVAAYGNYVYVSSPLTRFDTSDNFSSEQFATSTGYSRIQMGLDGLLYGITNSPGDAELDVYNPTTMAYIRQIPLNEDIRGVAVAADGDIYGIDLGGNLYHFDPNGNVLATTTLPRNTPNYVAYFCDLSLSPSGQIFATGDTTVFVTNTSFSSVSYFTTPGREDFVSYIAPEPCSLLCMLPCMALFARRRRPRH